MTTRSEQWLSETERLIDCVDSDDLPRQMLDSLSKLVPFTMATFFVNRGRSRPINLYDNFPDAKSKSGIENYINGTYVLNPFYLAHLKGLDLGVYRICDLAPDAFFENTYYKSLKITPSPEEEIGYVTNNWPVGHEEIEIAVPLGDKEDKTTAEIGLYCPIEEHTFDECQLDGLKAHLPVIGAITRKFWALRKDSFANSPLDNRIDVLFDNFGKPELSDREHEVIQHVLRGHSSESISFNLDISITTVKTHRKRAYGKLNISSQSELLSIFLQSIEPYLGGQAKKYPSC
jgi:DNA-binding CsgD family transcriptional regulator